MLDLPGSDPSPGTHVVQFKDDTLRLASSASLTAYFSGIDDFLRGDEQPDLSSTLSRQLAGFYERSMTYAADDSEDARHFDEELGNLSLTLAWNALIDRNTSKPDDLPAILATVLHLSAHEVLELDRSQRVLAMMRSQASLPLSLLFVPRTTMHAMDSKNRWAPVAIEGHIPFLPGASLNVIPRGLRVDFPLDFPPRIYRISEDTPRLRRFRMSDGTGTQLYIRLLYPNDDPSLVDAKKEAYILLYPNLYSQSGITFYGARLPVLSRSSTEVLLGFDCPLFTSGRPYGDDASNIEDNYDMDDWDAINAELVLPRPTLILQTRKLISSHRISKSMRLSQTQSIHLYIGLADDS